MTSWRLPFFCFLEAFAAGLCSFSEDTAAIWAPASLNATHVLLRPKEVHVSAPPARMVILVSAAPDTAIQQKILASYRLFINGLDVGIGPGRGEMAFDPAKLDAVYDTIEVPSAALSAAESISVALQCFHPSGGAGAWAMLEAEVLDADNQTLARIRTSSDWFSYNADSFIKKGALDDGAGWRVNEDIDARAFRNVSGWRLPNFHLDWSKAEVRKLASKPKAKTTLPISIQTGKMPVQITQISDTHYVFDFGQERQGGLSLTVPAETAAAWGGAGTELEIKLAEQHARFHSDRVLFPDPPLPNWNKIPRYISVFTLADGESHFEHHEYVGLWRYGEIRIRNPQALNAGQNFSLTQWFVQYPWKDEAAFVSSDSLLNSVWQLCYNTLKYAILDTFTDSNVREATPYEADGYCASRSYWVLRSEREWVRHSIQYIINNPTWPTEWLQYTILLVHGHYMQTGDASLADTNFDLLVENCMFPFIDVDSNLVNFTKYTAPDMESWPIPGCPFGGRLCNSPMCHKIPNATDKWPRFHAASGTIRCDNIDWLPKFRAGFHYSNVSTIINAFSMRGMEMLAELAASTGRPEQAKLLSEQAARTKQAMLSLMYNSADGMWCDGLCSTSAGTFHSQHYALFLGVTPDAGVEATLRYLQNQGMVGSAYSASSLLHGLYERASNTDFGQTALDLMTSQGSHSWYNMLRQGATTTWEHWFPHDGTHSHPWSATPASAIATGLMGVQPTAPGWIKWRAKPAPGDLTFAKATIATPKGNIMANFTHNKENLKMEISIPSRTEAELCMPLFGAQPKTVSLTLDGVHQQAREEKGTYLCVDGVIGRHRVTVAVVQRKQAQANLLPKLPRLNINPEAISISGLSAGADFASQFHVAFSKSIMGVGIFAGQPFHCAASYFPGEPLYTRNSPESCRCFCKDCPVNKTVRGDHCKATPQYTDVKILKETAEQLAAAGKIDDVTHIKKAKVYTFCGTNDPGHLGATVSARDFYAQFVPAENLLYNFTTPAGHCWPQSDGWNPCGVKSEILAAWPLQNCDYDGPGELLQHIYGSLLPPAKNIVTSSLWPFDQSTFHDDAIDLSSAGLIYVPKACAEGESCALHVSLHGCDNPMFMEYPEAHSMSFNRWAETNKIVVLWPHLAKHSDVHLSGEPYSGCWNAYAKGANYDSQGAPQMKAVRHMIEIISGVQMRRTEKKGAYGSYIDFKQHATYI